jgi:PAS domain S-box-containing protein
MRLRPMAPHPDKDAFELVRKLSAELRRRAGEVDTIFDLLPIGIGIADDPECRDIRVNRAFAEQLGISPGDNASLSAPQAERPAFQVIRDGRELRPDELPMQTAAREGIEVREVELDVVRADGRRVTLYEYAAPLFDEQGRVRGALGVFVDISARRRLEQEQRFLAEASSVLAASLDYESTLRALAQLAVPAFGDYCAVDVQRQDGAFERVELFTADEARQPIAEALKAFPPALGVDSPAARAIRTGEVIVVNESGEALLAQAAQSAKHLELLRGFGATSFLMVPLRARARTLGLLTAGSFSGRRYEDRDVALALNIAGRAALALDNALLYRDAQEANRLKEEFLATLSHELRTPLNALLGWTRMLKNDQLDAAGRQRALETIERNAQAQTLLINDLLDVARVTAGKLRLQEVRVDIPAVVQAALDAVRPLARARGVRIDAVVPPVEAVVTGDPDRLQQVIWNLLSNAVKFTPDGGRVEVAVEEPAGAVQIRVRDTGIGIEPELLPFVFERFRQGDSSTTRAHGGLGLGLAIVRHLVELHGGLVTASSDGPSHGAEFVVTLPASAAPEERHSQSPILGFADS